MTRKILRAGIALAALCVVASTGATQAAIASPLAVPSTSPTVSNGYVDPDRVIGCASGHVCIAVPYGAGRWVFDFYNYGSYSTYNWNGTGTVMNAQTGNAAFRYDDARGHQLGCIPADGRNHSVSVGPVYRVRVTATPC
ncbi:hypothetical protein AB0E69_27115 [Kribbella sp. NPDC026611]|uniref:hypothetical protein n=1 Tax=Kribbella sp. NPDC026611 TaxID=3154911 RepID=UPI0033D7F308